MSNLPSERRVRSQLIYNPAAGQAWTSFKPERVLTYLSRYGWDVELKPTEYAGHASELARQAVSENVDIVIAAGGDGTINEVVQGLAHSAVALGFLPVGTTNVLARELKLPLNPQEALKYLPEAQTVQIDLGLMNQRYFLLMAGFGYDAELVRDVNPQMKNVAGKLAVVVSGVMNVFSHKPFKVKIILKDAQGKKKRLRRSVMQIFVSNAATYATDYKIAEEARMDDGLLELHVFKSKRFQDTFFSLIAMLLRRHKEWVDFDHFSVRSVEIISRKPMPIQLDGDTVGTTPAHIKVIPGALKILRPKIEPA